MEHDPETLGQVLDHTRGPVNLLAVLPVSRVDFDLALNLIAWMRELGELLSGSFLLVCDEKLSKDQQQKLCWELCHLSEMPDAIVSKHYGPKDAWPVGPNWMWLNTARHVEANVKRPFIWIEPDSVPLKRDWMNSIDLEYHRFGKPFMGMVLKDAYAFDKLWPAHVPGVCVYPHDAATRLAPLNLETPCEAWDLRAGPIMVPETHRSRQIVHVWGNNKEPPHFVNFRSKGCPKNHMTLDQIPRDATIFHRVKTSSLIDLLRAGGLKRFQC